MKFGITNSSFIFPDGPGEIFKHLVNKVQQAEQAGFSWFSVMDHFMQIGGVGPVEDPMMESWTSLGALAGVTNMIRLGTLVSSVGYRNPALLAKMAATVDIISNGRLTLGIGAGWFEREYLQYGYEFPQPAKIRIDQMEEAVQLIKEMWTQESATFRGRYFSIEDAILEPKPIQKPHPPIMIGGEGRKFTLRVVARWADSCNVFGDPESVREKFSVLRSHCEDVGREFEEIERTVISACLLARSEAALQAKIGQHGIQDWIHGVTVSEAKELFDQYQDAGVDLLILNIHGNDQETLDLLADEILPSYLE